MPRALVHIKILDAARALPEASMERLSDEVDGATPELVDRVLETYGDPVRTEDVPGTEDDGPVEHEGDGSASGDDTENEAVMNGDLTETPTVPENIDGDTDDIMPKSTNGSAALDDEEIERAVDDETGGNLRESPGPENDTGTSESAPTTEESTEVGETETTDRRTVSDSDGTDDDPSDSPTLLDREQLTDKQLEVLLAIRDRPHATQSELADEFGVCRATVSQRVNAIEGFSWKNRRELIDDVFDTEEPMTDGNGEPRFMIDLGSRIDDLADRMEMLERSLDEGPGDCPPAFEDPELLGTAIRACIESDIVADDEEMEIVTELIRAGRK